MPDVAINGPQVANKQGFGTGIPTPILLAVVGGGIGLVVFLSRKNSDTASTDKGTLLPNTAVMLGSLQSELLNLEGKVTTGNADLSSQLAGVGENLGLQIDTQTGQMQVGFNQMNTNLTNMFNTLTAQQDALSSSIAQLTDVTNSGFGTLSEAQAKALQDQLTALQNMKAGVDTQLANIVSLQNQSSSKLDGLGNQVASGDSLVASYVQAIGRFLGWQFYQIPNRYAAYIPGQGPGNYGGTPIGML